ncbi:WbqC family protein [Cupriavidus pauculus]|uniref:WbqC family protein n=1 Tax=Cupriavidus pauculus TaxID=82633 RepID=UPI0007803250|nr:WbqC family protein [Cupriavidus pauculus]MBY4731292.1 WbqC family protein [Cupriavidus pauculus]
MKKVAILQSNYIPWKGYFDIIASVDEFILYDDMQYTRRDWRNRNQIKTPQGVQWLTVPVQVKGRYDQKIRDTRIEPESDWAQLHWKTLEQNYRRARHFEETAAWLRPIYMSDVTRGSLSLLNRTLIEAVINYLGVDTKLSWSWDYTLVEGKSERLADLCAQAGGTTYVSGPSAKDYVEEAVFDSHGIALEWFDYSGYPQYPQMWGEFEHGVSILDLLFNCGSEASKYMRYVHQ